MSTQTPQEREMAKLIVSVLELEDIEIDQIDPEAPLFGPDESGLELDSIDALEIVLAISRKYGVELRADDKDKEKIFMSLRNLTEHVEAQRPAT